MHLSVWNIKLSGRRTEQFATKSSDVHEVLSLYKSYFKKKHPDKAFNFESIERVTGIELLSENTIDVRI